jgi:S1-C subfamily serine protease
MPSLNSKKLDPRQIAQLQRSAFDIFQLDATAYPGNSGSPLYDPATGKVLGVINAVFVKGLKESAITNPSGITYAVPVKYVHALLEQK